MNVPADADLPAGQRRVEADREELVVEGFDADGFLHDARCRECDEPVADGFRLAGESDRDEADRFVDHVSLGRSRGLEAGVRACGPGADQYDAEHNEKRQRRGNPSSAIGPHEVQAGCAHGHGPIFYDVMSYFALRARRRRALFAAVGVVGLISMGCSDSEEPAASPPPAVTTNGLLAPAAFGEYLEANPDVPLINVHIPYDKHIAGTDAFIPFDAILDSPDLPADKTAPIAIYCRSGSMSAEAADDLSAAGYTNVIDLAGGMNAWTAAGDTLLDDPGAAGN